MLLVKIQNIGGREWATRHDRQQEAARFKRGHQQRTWQE